MAAWAQLEPSPEQPGWDNPPKANSAPPPQSSTPSATHPKTDSTIPSDASSGEVPPTDADLHVSSGIVKVQPTDSGSSDEEEVGVPSRKNFFLPNFDTYGKPFFERQGLRFRIGPVNLRMSLSAGLEYNDNIFGSFTDPVADNIVHIIPNILVGIGDFRDKEEDYFEFSYHPSINYYTEQTQQNGINQDLEVAAQATFSRYSTSVDLAYISTNSPSATQSGGVNYSTLSFAWNNTYYLGAKTFVQATLSALGQESETNNNYQTYAVSPQLGYAYSAKTTFFVGPSVGIAYIGDGATQTFQGLNVGFKYTNLRKLTINGTFGVQARQFDGLDTTGATNFMTPVFAFGAVYDAGVNTNVQIGFSRDVQLSDIQRGLTFTSTSFTVGLTQRILQKFSFNLGAGYQTLDYQGDAPEGRNDQYIFINPSLSYTFYHDLFNFSIFYRLQQRTSTIEQFGYDIHAYGFQLTYNF